MPVWTKEDTFKVLGLILFISAFVIVLQQLQSAEKRLKENQKSRQRKEEWMRRGRLSDIIMYITVEFSWIWSVGRESKRGLEWWCTSCVYMGYDDRQMQCICKTDEMMQKKTHLINHTIFQWQRERKTAHVVEYDGKSLNESIKSEYIHPFWMDAGELDFCVYFLILERESFFSCSFCTRIDGWKGDSFCLVYYSYMSIALGSIKSKKVLHILISTFSDTIQES